MTREEAIKILQNICFEAPEVKEALQIAIDALSRLSLPSNLDEAAEEYALDVKAKPFGGLVEDAFKAGAEWMAGQGDVIATRLVIDNKGNVNLNFAIGNITDENCKPKYHVGQDVIVQIRKK